ncbi:secretin N-terminal domain-containing protein [Dendrosporobacter sp. 1207_IL3150]|uniref:secretin N-terminal domain-containing protein n=1 Tax=Dendrosporobacter sp. 1207_IL3150 TaxID=3084054 RepID=UPI002FDA5D3A
MKIIKTSVTLMIFILLLTSAAMAANPKVNMNVTNGEVRDVLTALASIGGVNIVADDSVTGKITVQLQDVSFDTALDIVTKTKGYDYQKIGGVIVVGNSGQMSRGFGQINVFKLQHAKASDVVDLLSVVFTEKQDGKNNKSEASPEKSSSESQGNISVSSSSRIKVDVATNSLVFSGTPSEVAQIRKILTEVDIPYQQVSLEAQVLAINNDDAKNLGVEWEWSKGPNYPEYEIDDKGKKTVTRKTLDGGDNSSVPGIISFGRTPEGYSYEMYYQFKINALVTNGKANVLAKPKIMTINGKEAIINIGGEVPIPVTTTSNNTTTTSIEYKEAGIILKYTPRINADGHIIAKVHTEVSSPVLVPELKAYRFNKRSADTEVRLKDGETMVIGGLIGKDELKSMSKVPFLGDLPILGSLFRNNNNTKNESEVVIFLTAHIVK